MSETRAPRWAIVTRPRNRRLLYAVAAIVLAVLCVFPQPHVARAKLLPQESSSAGLGQIISSLGGQLSTFANLLTGGRAPNDLYLIIGRSDAVRNDVIAALKLVGERRPYATAQAAKIDLDKKVDVRLLLGGVVEIETTTRDPRESLSLTNAFVRAISDRIGLLTRQTTTRKGQIVEQRFREAIMRVNQTQGVLDRFRRQNRLASPDVQLGAAISLRTDLQARLQAKLVELQTVQQFAGPENPQLRAVQAELASLRAQIGRTERPTLSAGGPNVAGLSELSSEYLNLFRDYRFAQALYDVYARASEQVAVESLVAESASFIQVVEPANIDPERHYNVTAVALLALVVLLAAFTEFYAPATGLTWPDARARKPVDAGA